MNLRPIARKIPFAKKMLTVIKRKRQKYTGPPRAGNKYNIQGNWMYLDDKDSMFLARDGIFEPIETNLIKNMVKSNHTVLDIGAHIGYFTIIMAKQAKQVYAFEPEPRNFHTLQKNITLNELANVKLYNRAVAEHNYKTTLHLCHTSSGMHRLYPSKWCKEGTIEVETISINEIIGDADFIKMDIEGAELGALKGMKKLLEKNGPPIIMEFHPPSIEEYGVKPRAIYDFMKSLGYDMKIPLRNSLPFEELEKIAIENIGINLLCTRN
jgi:FkbM family methyltransferase